MLQRSLGVERGFDGLFVNIFEGQGLVVILENNRAILRKVRGLFRIKFYGERVYFGI